MDVLNKLSSLEVDWFYNHLVFMGGIQQSVGVTSSKERRALIQVWLEWNREQSVTNYSNEEKQILDTMKREALKDEDINWIDPKSRLQCLYIWGALRALNFFSSAGYSITEVSDGQIPSQYRITPEYPGFTSVFQTIMGNIFEVESSKIVIHVVDFFHRLRGTREHKVWLLNDLKIRSDYLAYKGSPAYEIANSDGETRSWAWSYLMSKGVPTQYLKANELEIEPEHLIVAFELWDVSDAEKELLLHRLKAAYSQRKTRMKRQDRKAYQIYLTPRHKDMLNQLAWEYDRKIYEVVEHLVSEAFHGIEKNKNA